MTIWPTSSSNTTAHCKVPTSSLHLIRHSYLSSWLMHSCPSHSIHPSIHRMTWLIIRWIGWLAYRTIATYRSRQTQRTFGSLREWRTSSSVCDDKCLWHPNYAITTHRPGDFFTQLFYYHRMMLLPRLFAWFCFLSCTRYCVLSVIFPVLSIIHSYRYVQYEKQAFR